MSWSLYAYRFNAMPRPSVCIAGAGLAGACAALYLSDTYDVHVIDAEEAASGASGAAAGLANPLMGRRAKLTWRAAEAWDALTETVARARAKSAFNDSGVLRPTTEPKQVRFFKDAASKHPRWCDWWTADALAERYPQVQAHDGALWLPRGGAVDVPALVRAALVRARTHGATYTPHTRLTDWTPHDDGVAVHTTSGGSRSTQRYDYLLCCVGQGYPSLPALDPLDLHGIKGQTLTVRLREAPSGLPPISGRGYIVPDKDTCVLGSSYEHEFADLQPSEAETQRILQKTQTMLPALRNAQVESVAVGVRVKHNPTNLPLVGPYQHPRTWVVLGLGSKGLLTAPLIARKLPRWLRASHRVPAAIRVPKALLPSTWAPAPS